MKLRYSVISIFVILIAASQGFSAGQHMMHARVPADHIEEARALKSPIPSSEENISKGKAIYEGKGNCVNCHGKTGRGDGPGATNLNPPPRVFRSHGFWKHRTEGEIFWVIKHGSPGTAMIPFGGLLTDIEIWTVLQYEQSFGGRHGQGKGMGHQKTMRPGEKHSRNKQHGMKESMKHKQLREWRGCCQESD